MPSYPSSTGEITSALFLMRLNRKLSIVTNSLITIDGQNKHRYDKVHSRTFASSDFFVDLR
jgi:hypothetical protein